MPTRKASPTTTSLKVAAADRGSGRSDRRRVVVFGGKDEHTWWTPIPAPTPTAVKGRQRRRQKHSSTGGDQAGGAVAEVDSSDTLTDIDIAEGGGSRGDAYGDSDGS